MNSNNYRYSLNTTNKKELCPNCGQKTFKRYIDNHTGLELNESVGRCDRENNCGFHKPPRTYFAEIGGGKNLTRKGESPLNIHQVEKNVQPQESNKLAFSTIDKQILQESINMRSGNKFFSFLELLFSKEVISDLKKKYLCGSTKDGETVFWQVDFEKRIRSGKIMMYDSSTGKRVKNIHPNWIHKKLKLKDFVLKQCLFGEYQLTKDPYKIKTVILVESEKTAIICAGAFPEQIWLATGGLNGLNEDKCKILQGRKVIAFSDLGGQKKWSEKSLSFRHIVSIEVSDLLEKFCTDEERMAGLDIGDYVIGQLLLRKTTAIAGTQTPPAHQPSTESVIGAQTPNDEFQKSHEKNSPSEPTSLHPYTASMPQNNMPPSTDNPIKIDNNSNADIAISKLTGTNIDREFAFMENEKKRRNSIIEKSSAFKDIQFRLNIGANEELIINFPILVRLVMNSCLYDFELIFEKSADQLEALRKSVIQDIHAFAKFKRSGFFKLKDEGYNLSYVFQLNADKHLTFSSGAFAFNLVCGNEFDLDAFRHRLKMVTNMLLINERVHLGRHHFDVMICFFYKRGYKEERLKLTSDRVAVVNRLLEYLKKMFPEAAIKEDFQVYSSKDVWVNTDLKRINWTAFQLDVT